ncbi:MAG: GAF domain-containing protein, partial [Calditrichaeota bacterium]
RQLLRQFSEELIFIKNNTELYQKMVEIIQKALEVDFCLAMEIQGNKGVFIAHTGELKIEQSTIHISDELKHALTSQRIFSGGDIQTLPLPAVITSVELCLSLSRDGKLLGVLLMGKRRERNGFRQEDLDLLQILAGQAAIAIENNLYIEESKKLIQKLTEAELRERYVAELEEKNQTLQKLYRELQDAQTQLIQSEKMASLGQLVAGVAHELNNPISFIYANMKQLQSYIEAIEALLNLISEFTDRKVTIEEFHTAFNRLNEQYDLTFIQEDINSLISESMEGSKRVKEVVQNLRNFSRLDEAEWKTANLHEGLDSTLMLLANEVKNRITVHKEYGQIPEIYCNPGQLNQVFMNLLLNACQAIEKKGDIWIRTRSTGKHVEIEIEDNGKGMPVEIQNRIFDPFFTTKPVGSGTGLGLSISYKIIEQHGGRLTFTSTPGKGTCFKISLPIHGVQPQD